MKLTTQIALLLEGKDSRPSDEIIMFRSGAPSAEVRKVKKEFNVKIKKKLTDLLGKTTNLSDKDKKTALGIIPKISREMKISLADAIKREFPMAKVN